MILCANPLAQYHAYKSEIDAAISRVLNSNRYILGQEVEQFEAEFSEYIGVKYAIGVANGTESLRLALSALDIGAGDEVITVSHTAVATVAAIESTGAVPVLVDIDEDFFTIDPNQLEEVLTPKTKAVIAVHIYGQPFDVNLITNFCNKNNLYLIEDVSQAHGARWNGQRLGTFGVISCFSCYPTKNLGAIGDAGIVATNLIELNQKLRMLREYGWKERYISHMPGINSRLDEIQAAILRVKLKYLEISNKKRGEIAKFYFENIKFEDTKPPKIRENASHAFHLFVIRTKHRDNLQEYLLKQGIQTGIHYPIPIHLQPAYKHRIKTSKNMGITTKISNEVLSLPLYPELTSDDVKKVCAAINYWNKNRVFN